MKNDPQSNIIRVFSFNEVIFTTPCHCNELKIILNRKLYVSYTVSIRVSIFMKLLLFMILAKLKEES